MTRFKRQNVPDNGSPVIRKLWETINEKRVSQKDVAAQAGVGVSSMRKWRQGVISPRLCDLEAVATVLGITVSIGEKNDQSV